MLRTISLLFGIALVLALVSKIEAQGSCQAPAVGNGIQVSGPRIIDEEALLRMIDQMKQQLAAYNLLDSGKVNSAVGQVSGQQKELSAWNFQATEIPKVAAENERGVDVNSTSPATSLPTSTLPAVAAPVLASRDVLMEQVALTQNIQTLRLALEGITADEFTFRREQDPGDPNAKPDVVAGRRKLVLLGFDLYLDSPKRFSDSVAEVVFSLDDLLMIRTSSNDALLVKKKYEEFTSLSLAVGMLKLLALLDGPGNESSKLQDARGLETDIRHFLKTEDLGNLSSVDLLVLVRLLDTQGLTGPHGGGLAERIELELDLTPRIVALLPNQETYNTARISNSTKNIGLGAIAGVVNLGYSWLRGSESIFIVQEADTLSMQFPRSSKGGLRFGWQIRPTGSQRMVRPGLHQLYALVSFPGSLSGFAGTVEMETRWRKWGSRRRTVGDAVACSEVKNWPVWDLAPDLRSSLEGPQAESVDFRFLGSGDILLRIGGRNFTEKTRLLFDGKIVAADSGLKVVSEKLVEVIVKKGDLLGAQNVWIQTEAGLPARVFRSDWESGLKKRDEKAKVIASKGGNDTYSFSVAWTGDARHQSEAGFGHGIFLLAADRVFNPLDEKDNLRIEVKDDEVGAEEACQKCDQPEEGRRRSQIWIISFDLPESYRGKLREIILRDLFAAGQTPSLSIGIDRGDLLALEKANITARTAAISSLAVFGNGFGPSLRFLLGGDQLRYSDAKWQSPSFLLFETSSTFAVPGNRLLAFREGTVANTIIEPILVVEIDPAPAVAEPIFESPSKVELGQGDNRDIVILGKNFESISKLTFNGEVVLFNIEEKGTRLVIKVESRPEITKEAAEARQLRVHLKNGKESSILFNVKPAAK